MIANPVGGYGRTKQPAPQRGRLRIFSGPRLFQLDAIDTISGREILVTNYMEFSMTSVKQLAANRANAQKSTGPRTEAGKSRSRRNAWKHGLTAREIISRAENAADFDALRAELWDQVQPAAGLESVLCDRLVAYAWRMRRVPGLEARCFDSGNKIDYANAGFLTTLARYEMALLNAFDRTLQQLTELQDRRHASELEHAVDAIALPLSDDTR